MFDGKMNRIIIFIISYLFISFLFSCNSQPENKEVKNNIDSIKNSDQVSDSLILKEEKLNTQKSDSLYKDSLLKADGQNLLPIRKLYFDFRLKNIIHSNDTIEFFEIKSIEVFDSLFETLPYPYVKSKPKYPAFDSVRVFCLSLVDYNDFDMIYVTSLLKKNNELNINFDISDRPYKVIGHQQEIFSLPKSERVNEYNFFTHPDGRKLIQIKSF